MPRLQYKIEVQGKELIGEDEIHLAISFLKGYRFVAVSMLVETSAEDPVRYILAELEFYTELGKLFVAMSCFGKYNYLQV